MSDELEARITDSVEKFVAENYVRPTQMDYAIIHNAMLTGVKLALEHLKKEDTST